MSSASCYHAWHLARQRGEKVTGGKGRLGGRREESYDDYEARMDKIVGDRISGLDAEKKNPQIH